MVFLGTEGATGAVLVSTTLCVCPRQNSSYEAHFAANIQTQSIGNFFSKFFFPQF